MAGWNYIKGESGFDRPIVVFEKGKIKGFDATGVTAVTYTIIESDLTPTTPAISNVATTVDVVNPLRVLVAVDATGNTVPQTPNSYIVQFKVTIAGTEIRKTFELDLRVFNG